MNPFLEWFLPILALSIGVMILTVFFNLLAAVKRWLSPTPYIKVKGSHSKGFLEKDARVTLHLKRGETVENVRLVGFTDIAHAKNVPYPLRNMVVVESLTGERMLFRADDIQSIRQVKGETKGVPRDAAAPPDPGQ